MRILAGLSGNDSEETQAYFARALADLGITVPDRRECLIHRCGDVSRGVLEGTIPPLSAFNLLWQITMELNYPAVLRCWTQLETDLDTMEYMEVPTTEREDAVRLAGSSTPLSVGTARLVSPNPTARSWLESTP